MNSPRPLKTTYFEKVGKCRQGVVRGGVRQGSYLWCCNGCAGLSLKEMCKRGVVRQEDRLEFLNKSGVAHFFAVFNGNMPTFVFSIGLISDPLRNQT